MENGPSPFSNSFMQNYYVYRTEQVCRCGSCIHTLLSQHVYVKFLNAKGKSQSLPMRKLLERYMGHFEVDQDRAERMLPHLPMLIQQKILTVEWCEKCTPDFLGDEETGLPAMLPVEFVAKKVPIKSPNEDFDIRVRQSRKSRQDKARKEAAMAVSIQYGPLENLL